MARCLRRSARLGYHNVVVKIDAAIVCVLFVGLSLCQPLAAHPHSVRPGGLARRCRGCAVVSARRRPGHAVAQFVLGPTYADGVGVPQDWVAAYMWLSLAVARASAAGGDDHDTYVEVRDAVAEQMTSEQVAEAERRASEWKPADER